MKNKTLIDSIKCAVRGLIFAVKTEKNYKYYTAMLICILIAHVISKVDTIYNILLAGVYLGACSAECLNTAIEHIVDKSNGDKYDKEIGIIKDLGASGVLCWGIMLLVLEGYVICKKLNM